MALARRDQPKEELTRGLLILNPDKETLSRYEQTRTSFQSFETELGALRDFPATTRDGTHITLLGNIEFPQESSHCLDRGAEGVGLYRTEFLYLGRTSAPTVSMGVVGNSSCR